MRLIVAIATTNRPKVVVTTLRDLERQTRKPDHVMVIVADESDIDPDQALDLPFPVEILLSERGATLQRNRALEHTQDDDLVLYIDDDFLMAPDYLENLEQLFETHADVVMSTGHVRADGIHGPGITFEDGRRLATLPVDDTAKATRPETIYNCYGCNMAARARPIREHQLRFDPRLKLYAWLEDLDFSRQMAAHGRIVKWDALVGVHLGTKAGRSNGVPLGYSQISNPIYLNRKGTMATWRALRIISRNLASNLVKSLRPEPEIDRWGRLKGNLRAFADLFRGRLEPEKILQLK